MGKNKKKGASRIEKATAKREKKIAQRIKKDIGKIGEVNSYYYQVYDEFHKN